MTCSAFDQKFTLFRSGPYDAIHVGAAASTLPAPLVEQLVQPGRMFIPVGDLLQNIEVIDKDSDNNVRKKKILGVRVCQIFQYKPTLV